MENINYVAHLKGLSADNMRHIPGFPSQKPALLLIQSINCFLVMRQYLAESLETVTVEEGHEQAGSEFWRIAARPPGVPFLCVCRESGLGVPLALETSVSLEY